MKALLIAEKPSLRRIIEDVYKKHKSTIPYDIDFMDQRGHLLTLKMPDEIDEALKKWDWETLPIHPENYGGFKYKIIEEKKVGSFLTSKERFNAIKKQLSTNDYDFVINAGDPDQEGELLIRIVLSALRNTLPVKRYWSNDTTEAKVLDALLHLKDDDTDPMLLNLLAAAYARQHSDYRFGVNGSRACSLKMDMRVATGRVESTIQAFVCRREEEIMNFVPKTVYGVKAVYSEGFEGILFDSSNAESSEESDEKEENSGIIWFDTKEEAEAFISSLRLSSTVTLFETKRVESFAPKLFKLASAQVMASKIGFSSSKTLETIQSLYDKGYLSYPRTDCEFVSSGENFSAMLESAACVPFLEPFVKSITPSAIGKVKATKKWVNNKKLQESGHSALVPTTKKPDFSTLSDDEQKIYTLICRQFVAIFLPPLVQDKTLLISDCDGNTFKSTGKTLVDAGYSKIFNAKFTDMEIPVHKKGDSLTVNEFSINEKTSTCPKRFTDGDLIAVCEAPHKYLDDMRLKALGKNLKVGTPATRANIIERLIIRDKYLARVKEKKVEYVVPTKLGMAIYQNLKDVALFKVDMTGQWEEKLEAVRKGELTLKELEKEMKVDVDRLVEEIRTSTTIRPVKREKKFEEIGTCPNCGGTLIASEKGFFCKNYRDKDCKVGAFAKLCDSTISKEEFLSLISGKEIIKELKKDKHSWKQRLIYNFKTNKIEFFSSTEDTEYKCPKCGCPITKTDHYFECSNECGFKFYRTPGGHELTESEAKSFFTTGKTGVIKKMKGKNGRYYSANLIWNPDKDGGAVEYKYCSK